MTVEPSRRVLLGVSWDDGDARVRLRDDDDTASRLVPLAGLQLNSRALPDSPRRCIGRVPVRRTGVEYHDCVQAAEPGGRTCVSCSVAEANLASSLHHAHTRDRADIDPAVDEHLRQPNVLYLAAFRDGSTKVGTSTERRLAKRLVEQGAWLATVVAGAADGYAVRDVEDRVTSALGIPQSVSVGRKLDGMASPRPEAQLAELLAEQGRQVRALVVGGDDGRLSPTDQAWSFPGQDDPVWDGLHRYPLRLDSGQHDLEVLAACGRLVAVRRPGSDDTFVADLGQLFGVELELGDYESDELAVQDRLF